MTNKYIIKKCPAFLGEQIQCASYPVLCKDKTNCTLKWIVEKCREKVSDDICLNCNSYESGFKCWQCDYKHHREDIYNKNADVCFAKEILSILEIQECGD